MPIRKFTVTFDVAEDEFQNFMTRLAGGSVLSNEIPRNTTIDTGDDENGPADANAPAVNEHGVPWDARYHGTAKKVNADKSWKRIKGLSEALKAEADAFEANAKAAFAAASAAPAPVVAETAVVAETPVTTAVETAAAPAPVVGLPVAAPAPVAAAGMPGLPMPTAVVTPPPVSYEDVVAKFQAVAATHPHVTSSFLQIYAECGITDPNALTTEETLRRKLFDKLTEIGNSPAVAA